MKKQRMAEADWWSLWERAASVSAQQAAERKARVAAETIARLPGQIAVATSGGKDSLALELVAADAGVLYGVVGVCDLEYPAYSRWLDGHRLASPLTLTIHNTGQGLQYLVDNPDALFPRTSNHSSRYWYSKVQHKAQREFFRSRNLSALLLCRRRADGNYAGPNGDGTYTKKNGVRRVCPMFDWSHLDILALLRSRDVPLPPWYQWPRGWRTGTGPWAKRRPLPGMTVQDSWHELAGMDRTIVEHAATRLPSAARYLETHP